MPLAALLATATPAVIQLIQGWSANNPNATDAQTTAALTAFHASDDAAWASYQALMAKIDG